MPGIKRAVRKGTKAPATKDETAQSDQQDKEFFSEDDQGPYYKIKNKEMVRLWRLAQNLRRIEEVREVYWEAPANPESIEDIICFMLAREREEIVDSQEWAGVEKACAACDIGRSRLYQLLDECPEIETLSLKRPGKTKGRRLIYLPSLLEALRRMARAQREALAV